MREVELRYEVTCLVVHDHYLFGKAGTEWRSLYAALVSGSDEHGLFKCNEQAHKCKRQVELMIGSYPVAVFVNEVEIPPTNQREN